MQKRLKIYTLGCKLNYAESSAIGRAFEDGGGVVVDRKEVGAEVVVVNSCAVTSESEKKTRELIRRVVRENMGAEVVVTGCYAKLREHELLAIEGVSRVETVKNLTAWSFGERTRSFLKVQDGCDYHCTYCTVWRARGESRNLPVAEIVRQAREIATLGAREIVLTGVNIGDFGKSTGESFLQLIQELDRVEGIDRYRISSIEPNLLTTEVIEFCRGSERFMPHFHIPLQSGADAVLRNMGRRYRGEDFCRKVEEVRSAIPDVFLGVDVIVGFPGEEEEEFQQTLQVLERTKPAFLHVFPYSKRPDTPAADFPDQVDEVIKKERVKLLNALSDKLLADFTQKYKDTPKKILVEGRNKEGKFFGHSENYIRVEFFADHDENLIGRYYTTK